MRVKLIAVTLLCLILGCVGSVTGEESKEQVQDNKEYQIVFSIFDRSSAGSYSYLGNSIQAMLASRLAARDRVNVLDKTFSEKELTSLKKQGSLETLSIGGENTDYLITGALFSLTSGLETHVDLYPLVPEKEVLHFSVLSKTPDTLIADVEQLSREIAQRAFGYQPKTPGEETSDNVLKGNEGFVTVHPEAAYKKKIFSGTVVGVAGSGVKTKGRGAQIKQTVSADMRAMAVGDVTGDGEKEILLLAGSELMLYSKIEKSLEQVAKTSLPRTIVSHAIYTADLDGDGKDEIYISATDGLYVSSLIMKYDATGGFQIVSRNIPWYLRPLFVPGKDWQLVGQKRGVEKIDLIRPGLYLLSMDSKYKMSKGERLALPTSVNLFDFVYADLDGDSFHEIVAVDEKEKLRVYNPGNELMWVSKKQFASSKVYLGPSRGGATSESNDRRNFTVDEDADRDLIFVPGRLIVTDIDNDGKEEIVVSEGKSSVPGFFRFFNTLRFYDSGAVVSMAWTGSSLVESWRTGNFQGYVAGYGFTLLEDEQLLEKTEKDDSNKTMGRLFVGHLPQSGSLAEILPGGGKTELTLYGLEFTHKKVEK
ncbi:MAG: VCBS repeat-containing protein [Desulfobulbaceae bacterium]|nr:VCBS repeat-containing protein [Desulfobulbaceae bacterium]